MEQEVEADIVDNGAEEIQQGEQIKEELTNALSKAFGRKQEELKQELEVDVEYDKVEAEYDKVEAQDQDQDQEEDISAEDKGEDNEEEDLFPIISKDWSKEEQERFTSALKTPELKEAASVFTERYEQLKKGFYKKADETANLKKTLSAWEEVYDSGAKETLAKRGINEQDYVKQLLQVDRMLSQNPAETIKKIMEGFKVTPDQMGFSTSKADDADGDDFFDSDNKQIDQLKKEIADLKSSMQQEKTQVVEQQQKSVESQIRDFKHAIDDNGEPKYPLFEEVKEEMSIFLQNGKASTLEEAYNMSPTIKEKKLSAKSEADEKAKLEADRKKVQDAKRASRGVSNKKSVPMQTPRKKMSIEERFAENFKKAGAI